MRKIRTLIIGTIIALTGLNSVNAQTSEGQDDKMQWFDDAKLGIFIHWGIYAVNGIDESWSFFNGYISHDDYMKQLGGFTAKRYDPQEWAGLIKDSGAGYAVLTTKHHDGVALWKTKYGELNVVKHTPAKRDLVQPFAQALREQNLKVGLYYSLPDWSYPDYPNKTRTEKRYEDDEKRWSNFLKYYQGQLTELSEEFNPDLFWFDGDWEFTADEWQADKVKMMLRDKNPQVIINSRLGGHGDYDTPEQGVPVTRPESQYWELCMTMNNSWGYQGNDKEYKTPYQIIGIFVDCISMGGNLLLDIGPKADGTIPEEQREILQELGRWTSKHAEAIYGSRAGLPAGHFYGPTTLSADGETLYLFLPQRTNHPIVIKGLKNKINRIRIVGNGTKLEHKVIGKQYWSEVPGLVYIDVPEDQLDEQVTVIAVQLKGKVDLYREDGQKIESN